MSHIRGYYCILNIINHPVFSYLKVMLLIGFIVRNHTGHYGPYFNHWYQCQFFKGFSIQNFQRFSLFSNYSNSVNIWARRMSFFFKQVRISPEIDWYHYQSASAAPNGIVRHRIKTDQFSRSVTSEPTVPPLRLRGLRNFWMVPYLISIT